MTIQSEKGRSRKGAWIEIFITDAASSAFNGRSRKGAWIEINLHRDYRNSPIGRSRKGAWIEIFALFLASDAKLVAPVRERGLKSYPAMLHERLYVSLP